MAQCSLSYFMRFHEKLKTSTVLTTLLKFHSSILSLSTLKDLLLFITDNTQVVFYHSTQPIIYISHDEGETWTPRNLSPNTINPRSFVWNPRQEKSAIAHDGRNDFIYVTQDVGQTWIKIAENVDNPFDYQW